MSSSEKGQSLIEILVVLVLTAMMIIVLITIILLSLKNAQFAQNQTKATKLAQDTVDQIRILRDGNKNNTLIMSGTPLVLECFKELWNSNNTNFGCGGGDCYYKLAVSGLDKKDSLSAKENLGDGFFRQIKIKQKDQNEDQNANNSEVTLTVEISWTDSTGEHNSNLETYLIKPNYECIE